MCGCTGGGEHNIYSLLHLLTHKCILKHQDTHTSTYVHTHTHTNTHTHTHTHTHTITYIYTRIYTHTFTRKNRKNPRQAILQMSNFLPSVMWPRKRAHDHECTIQESVCPPPSKHGYKDHMQPPFFCRLSRNTSSRATRRATTFSTVLSLGARRGPSVWECENDIMESQEITHAHKDMCMYAQAYVNIAPTRTYTHIHVHFLYACMEVHKHTPPQGTGVVCTYTCHTDIMPRCSRRKAQEYRASTGVVRQCTQRCRREVPYQCTPVAPSHSRDSAGDANAPS